MNVPILKQTVYNVGGVQYHSKKDAEKAAKSLMVERRYTEVVDKFNDDSETDWSAAQLRCVDYFLKWLDHRKMYTPKTPTKKATKDAIKIPAAPKASASGEQVPRKG